MLWRPGGDHAKPGPPGGARGAIRQGLLPVSVVQSHAIRDPGVRAAAIFAASFRKPIAPKLSDALVQAAKADPVEHVRTSAITLLRQHPGDAPHLAETLAWIAQHDPQPGVRNLAQEALKSVSEKPAQ